MKEETKEAIQEVTVPVIGSLMSAALTTAMPLMVVWHLAPTSREAAIAALCAGVATFGATAGGAFATHIGGSVKRAQQQLKQNFERIDRESAERREKYLKRTP